MRGINILSKKAQVLGKRPTFRALYVCLCRGKFRPPAKSDLYSGQYRTKIVLKMRREIFRQII